MGTRADTFIAVFPRMTLSCLTFPPITGPFTLEHVREAELWTSELLAWTRRATGAAGGIVAIEPN